MLILYSSSSSAVERGSNQWNRKFVMASKFKISHGGKLTQVTVGSAECAKHGQNQESGSPDRFQVAVFHISGACSSPFWSKAREWLTDNVLRLALFQSKWRGRRPLVSSKVNIDPGQALCGEPTLLSNQFKPLLLQVQRLMNDETLFNIRKTGKQWVWSQRKSDNSSLATVCSATMR